MRAVVVFPLPQIRRLSKYTCSCVFQADLLFLSEVQVLYDISTLVSFSDALQFNFMG